MIIADKWKDYELLDTGDGDKLERWGNFILRRPDPQIIWPIDESNDDWKKADAQYMRFGGSVASFINELASRDRGFAVHIKILSSILSTKLRLKIRRRRRRRRRTTILEDDDAPS